MTLVEELRRFQELSRAMREQLSVDFGVNADPPEPIDDLLERAANKLEDYERLVKWANNVLAMGLIAVPPFHPPIIQD